MKNYPLINGFRRRPNKKFDGSKNYGKPCVICGTGTIGEMWVQVSFMVDQISSLHHHSHLDIFLNQACSIH